MAGALSEYKYTSDNGTDYSLRLDSSNQTAVSGTAATTEPSCPRRIHPRFIYVEHPTDGRRRKIVLGNPASAIWVGGTSTVSITWDEGDAAPVTAPVRGRIGERRFST